MMKARIFLLRRVFLRLDLVGMEVVLAAQLIPADGLVDLAVSVESWVHFHGHSDLLERVVGLERPHQLDDLKDVEVDAVQAYLCERLVDRELPR